VPDGLLDAALARIEATQQRPGWLRLEWWLPARTADRARWATRTAIVFATIALLVALAIALGVFIGSRHRLPPPLGLARPGLIAFDVAGDIYVSNADGSGRIQLTSGPDIDTRATWSRDGTTIAYETQLAADLSTSVIVMADDGSHRTSLADHLSEVGALAWSPDSRQVAFSAHLIGEEAVHIFVADVDHPSARELGSPDLQGIDPSWSPNGTMIAFKHEDPSASTSTLWLIGADGSHAHELPGSPTATISGGDNGLLRAAWSRDGKRLAVLAAGQGGAHGSSFIKNRVSDDWYPQDVYVVGSDGSGLLDITNSLEDESWPSWSPEGDRIAFAKLSPEGQNVGMFIVTDPDGSDPVTLTGALVTADAPVWSPDGTHLLGYAYDPSVGSNVGIAVFDASGRAPPIIVPEDGLMSANWQRMTTGASWQRLAP
jgi:Tol biopolymer transport system component